jgi:hypothetical protein
VSIGSGYGGYGYGSPYYGGYGYGSPYYGGYGYGSPYYGGYGYSSSYGGWNNGWYYPGTGYYAYDSNHHARRISSQERGIYSEIIRQARRQSGVSSSATTTGTTTSGIRTTSTGSTTSMTEAERQRRNRDIRYHRNRD